MSKIFKRSQFTILRSRLEEPRKFIQVLTGPRQTGKTTLALQVGESFKTNVHYASADDPALHGTTWLEQQWEIARQGGGKQGKEGSILYLDEVQKIPGWQETAKRLWDEDTRAKIPLKVVLLGSAPLLLQQGLTESLAGRFEVIPVPHWSYTEMKEAFGWTLDEYIYFGGYPGSAELISDQQRWINYIQQSLIETTVSRDILLMNRIDKPALLRQMFQLGCMYSGQIVSYQKLVGQLQDAGNTTTLAHYLKLLSGCGLLTGLEKYYERLIRQRASSPKLLALNTALLSAQQGLSYDEVKSNPEIWGRFVETCIGAHLVNNTIGAPIKVLYWREGAKEVDYVLQRGKSTIAIEVKSGKIRQQLQGMDAFAKQYKPAKLLVVGSGGIPLETFLTTPVANFF